MKTLLAAALAALLVQPLWAIDKPTGAVSATKPRIVILNFPSDFDGGDLGQKAAYSLRAKLRRSSLFAMPDELDFDDMESRGAARPRPDDVAAAQRLAATFKPRFLVWGEVSKTGDTFAITVKGVDLEGEQPEVTIRKTPTDLRAFALACGELADELAETLAGTGYREVFPSKSTEGYVRASENLLGNGDFERGGEAPDNWERPDGLCSFWETNGEHGRHIRFDTDVYLSQWQEWRKTFEAGGPAATAAAPEKRATAGNKYDTVGGTYGVHLYSDAIAVKPGATYSVEFDAKGPTAADFFFAKVFVKGYGKEGPATEYYNMYKAVRTEKDNRWQHFSRIFHPTERTPRVACMRVMLFAYWPPGEYAFDNVEIFEVKGLESSGESRRETDEPAR